MRPSAFLALALVSLLLAAGCGSDETASSSTGTTLTVSAATSLKKAFERCAPRFEDAKVRLQFAGSDELAAQIRQGVKPDVYAAANTKLPDQLARAGLLSRPVVFAGNRLVIAVPKDSTVASIGDLAKSGTKLVIGAKEVPVGSYTRDVLGRLPSGQQEAILANVKSEEPDVGGVIGKLTQGGADAGFTYVTDVTGAGGALKAVELPAALRPSVQYGAGIVNGAKNPRAAQAFIDSVRSGPCSEVMRQAGFEPPPR
jgi:molybdate transport system substrate-binding protein